MSTDIKQTNHCLSFCATGNNRVERWSKAPKAVCSNVYVLGHIFKNIILKWEFVATTLQRMWLCHNHINLRELRRSYRTRFVWDTLYKYGL